MALTTRLMLRQGQSLVMTPQLLQAIKLLQLSNIELATFVEAELERNPLLERAEEEGGRETEAAEPDWSEQAGEGAPDGPSEAWNVEAFSADHSALARDLGAETGNAFDADRTQATVERAELPDGLGLSAQAWTGTPGGDSETANVEAYVAADLTLAEHLAAQLSVAVDDAVARMIGRSLIDHIDESGYLTADVTEIADRLGVASERVEAVLKVVQAFDPVGVGARHLAECLEIQLREKDRFDPAMAALIGHLDLLAKRDYAALRRLCGVDDEDLADMVKEVRRLNPKPGNAFGAAPIQPVVPDIYVRPGSDRSWHVELNSDVLPRLLVNQSYYAKISVKKTADEDKSFISNCLQTANWLTKSLEQRARTILKVATEIVRHQDAFLAQGVAHLRPLTLKTVADAIGMHESTVSRVTSNKYMATPRGLFELKYFFTVSIAASEGGEAHSAEAVRFQIKQMIDQESPNAILSDDAIVLKLKAVNIDIARRTVAKYRESLRIPSSVERRREKQVMTRG
ncbi:RNA polymerase factor sigma-54 [Methylovirgula sp. 4M-Z18]|uniref:RNA polymerase factor sigma-54 n=1 Tax=Methylovirgula sp. 4M-Z18 TaxID=2293567 RepID=UPI000E2ED5D4|nr:RNA polymerase factor sigma-54 [Methylovirgula sp. 4M-Z18]RFB79563.1 RNA polymerase sigma-54 factor [Methylovirgula sp. 4M-Z18]